jgi:hypothetical protein
VSDDVRDGVHIGVAWLVVYSWVFRFLAVPRAPCYLPPFPFLRLLVALESTLGDVCNVDGV